MFLLVGFMVAFNLGKTILSNVSGCMPFDDMYGYYDGFSLMYLHLNMNGNMKNNMYMHEIRKLLYSFIFFFTLYGS